MAQNEVFMHLFSHLMTQSHCEVDDRLVSPPVSCRGNPKHLVTSLPPLASHSQKTHLVHLFHAPSSSSGPKRKKEVGHYWNIIPFSSWQCLWSNCSSCSATVKLWNGNIATGFLVSSMVKVKHVGKLKWSNRSERAAHGIWKTTNL